MTYPNVPLRRIFRVVNGGTPTSEPSNWDGEIPWATPIDIGAVNGDRLKSTARTITRAGLKLGSRAVPAGSLIVSTRAPIGYVAEVDRETAFNQGCRGLVSRHEVDLRFFRYQVLALARQLDSLGQGSTFRELSTEALASNPVVVPPLPEQRAIADFLDAETARIDQLVALRRRGMTLADERLLSEMDAAILTPNVPVERLRRVSGGVTVGVVVNPSTYVVEDGDVPFFRGVEVSRFFLDVKAAKRITADSNRQLAKSVIRYGDIVSMRVGDPGISAVVPWEADGSNCASLLITRASRRTDSRYLCYVFNSNYGRNQFKALATGAAQLQVNVSAAVDFLVPLPDFVDQRHIADRLDNSRQSVSALSASTLKQVALLKEHRQALITAAVTGEIDVSTVSGRGVPA